MTRGNDARTRDSNPRCLPNFNLPLRHQRLDFRSPLGKFGVMGWKLGACQQFAHLAYCDCLDIGTTDVYADEVGRFRHRIGPRSPTIRRRQTGSVR